MTKYGKVWRTDDWWQARESGGGLDNDKLVAVHTDKDGITWYYFQEVLN
jgi:hypothetical protein